MFVTSFIKRELKVKAKQKPYGRSWGLLECIKPSHVLHCSAKSPSFHSSILEVLLNSKLQRCMLGLPSLRVGVSS